MEPLLGKDTAVVHDGSDLLTRQQAAEILGVCEQTLATWACVGRYGLPMVKVGSRVRYRRRDLDAWLDRRTVGVASD